MKTYFIKSIHEIYLDSYTEGELENLNSYDMKSEIVAENTKEAIKKYFETVLGYSFTFDLSLINEDNKNILHYSNLVDNMNIEASENEIEKWRNGEINLYSDNTILFIYELTEVEI